jgi:hypothetical protein
VSLGSARGADRVREETHRSGRVRSVHRDATALLVLLLHDDIQDVVAVDHALDVPDPPGPTFETWRRPSVPFFTSKARTDSPQASSRSPGCRAGCQAESRQRRRVPPCACRRRLPLSTPRPSLLIVEVVDRPGPGYVEQGHRPLSGTGQANVHRSAAARLAQRAGMARSVAGTEPGSRVPPANRRFGALASNPRAEVRLLPGHHDASSAVWPELLRAQQPDAAYAKVSSSKTS